MTKKKNKNIDTQLKDPFNMDEILKIHNLDYQDLDFESNSNELSSYRQIRKETDSKIFYLEGLYQKVSVKTIKYIKVAAVAVFILLTSIGAYQIASTNNKIQFATITVKEGERINLQISENITVWLNSNTELKIPMDLTKNSEFYLNGEGYFEFTAKSKRSKIRVVSNGLNFYSHGGSFHINSNENEQLIAHVSKGKVELKHAEINNNRAIELAVNDKINYIPSAGFIAIDRIEDNNYLAWKTGVIKFDNASLKEATKVLSAYFEVPLSIENSELINKKISIDFEYPQLDEVLSELKASLHCNISGDGSKIIIN